MSKNSNKAEFEKFYNKHIDKVYRFVFFRVNCETELAQDLVSEIFLKAVEHFKDYDKNISNSAWIMTITRNHLANYWRDKKPIGSIPDSDEGLSEGFWLESALKLFKKDQSNQELANLLEALDPEAKEIVTFHYLLGYSYAEIGEMKQMTETAIKVAAHRAVKKLSANI